MPSAKYSVVVSCPTFTNGSTATEFFAAGMAIGISMGIDPMAGAVVVDAGGVALGCGRSAATAPAATTNTAATPPAIHTHFFDEPDCTTGAGAAVIEAVVAGVSIASSAATTSVAVCT